MCACFFHMVGGNRCSRLEERGGRLVNIAVERRKISGTKPNLCKSQSSAGCAEDMRAAPPCHREIIK